MLTIPAAMAIAVALLIVSWPLGRSWAGRLAREAAIIFGLYVVWQYLLIVAVVRTGRAVARGRWVLHAERLMRLPGERTVQGWFLPHRWMLSFGNAFYAIAHYPDVLLALAWVYFWHRNRYPWARTLLIVATALSIPLQAIPVAPPRLIPGIGVVDTGPLLGQAVYSPAGLRDAAQLTAMPSVHVLWASLAAAMVIVVSRSRWRWLVLLHPVVTFWAVVVTGNHWWLDGIVSLALLGVALVAVPRILSLMTRFGPSRAFARAGSADRPSRIGSARGVNIIAKGCGRPWPRIGV